MEGEEEEGRRMEGQPAWWKEVEEEGGPEQVQEEEGEEGGGERHDIRAPGAFCSRSGTHAAYPFPFGPGRSEGPQEEEGEEGWYRQEGNEGDPKAQHRRVARA